MNREYGKLNGTEIGEYAPDGLVYDGRYHTNPTEAAYNAQGWLKIVEERPSPEEGYELTPTRYEERDGRISRIYERVPLPPPPPKVYAKYYLGMAIQECGYIETLLAFLASNPVLAFHWNNANEFEEGDRNFEYIKGELAKLVSESGVTSVFAKYREIYEREEAVNA